MTPVPNIGIVFATSLLPQHRAALQDAMDGSRSDLAELLGVDALVEGDDATYNGMRELFEATGVDSLALSH
jgi:ABC-type phosphate/phosphonate transport system substrate-binding protein